MLGQNSPFDLKGCQSVFLHKQDEKVALSLAVESFACRMLLSQNRFDQLEPCSTSRQRANRSRAQAEAHGEVFFVLFERALAAVVAHQGAMVVAQCEMRAHGGDGYHD